MRGLIFILAVTLLTVGSIPVGPAIAQEGGTPPVTVIPVPTPLLPESPSLEEERVPASPPPEPVEQEPTPPATDRSDVGGLIVTSYAEELPWLFAVISAVLASAVTSLVMHRTNWKRFAGSGGSRDETAPYELLAFVFEETRPGEVGLRVLTHGDFEAMDRAIEAAHTRPPIKTLAGTEARVWWVVTSGADGSTRVVLRPADGETVEAKSLTRIERLLDDLDQLLGSREAKHRA